MLIHLGFSVCINVNAIALEDCFCTHTAFIIHQMNTILTQTPTLNLTLTLTLTLTFTLTLTLTLILTLTLTLT